MDKQQVMTRSSILIFGAARDLIESRRMVLEHAGFSITTSLSLEQTVQNLKSRSFDLFMLCHSLSSLDCESALSQVHALRPEMNNLILAGPLSTCLGTKNDAQLFAFADPATLIAIASRLTTRVVTTSAGTSLPRQAQGRPAETPLGN